MAHPSDSSVPVVSATEAIAGVLQSQQDSDIPWQLRLFTSIPVIRDLPPRMIAFGPRRVRLNVKTVGPAA